MFRSAQAPACKKGFASEPTGCIGRKENDNIRNIIGATRAAKGSLAYKPVFKVGADDTLTNRSFRLNQARVDAIDSNFPLPEFPREHASDGVQCTLGPSVNHAVSWHDSSYARSDVDDTATLGQVI